MCKSRAAGTLGCDIDAGRNDIELWELERLGIFGNNAAVVLDIELTAYNRRRYREMSGISRLGSCIVVYLGNSRHVSVEGERKEKGGVVLRQEERLIEGRSKPGQAWAG